MSFRLTVLGALWGAPPHDVCAIRGGCATPRRWMAGLTRPDACRSASERWRVSYTQVLLRGGTLRPVANFAAGSSDSFAILDDAYTLMHATEHVMHPCCAQPAQTRAYESTS